MHCIILNTKEINNIGYFLASKNSTGEVSLRAWVQSGASTCGIYGRQSSTEIGFAPRTLVFPCHFHSSNASYILFICYWCCKIL